MCSDQRRRGARSSRVSGCTQYSQMRGSNIKYGSAVMLRQAATGQEWCDGFCHALWRRSWDFSFSGFIHSFIHILLLFSPPLCSNSVVQLCFFIERSIWTGLLHTAFGREGVTEFPNNPVQFVLLVSECFNGWNCVNHTDGQLHNGFKSVRVAFSHSSVLPHRDSTTAFTNCYLFRDCPHPPSDSRTFCQTLWECSNRW